ncbi:site-specific integrase [Pseudomonas mandelii]|nr:site-specific integrase [Pseudomonas mandelii]
MEKALSNLNPTLVPSLKHHLISFTAQCDYAPASYGNLISAFRKALLTYPTSSFDSCWIAKALTVPTFHRIKNRILCFFLHWLERDNVMIDQSALSLLNGSAAHLSAPRNVLSDDPNKSWLTNEEYDDLLSVVWNNYDSGKSSTQVTLIKLLSMQYARRPVQIANLKIGDIQENDGSDKMSPIGKVILFPGSKDKGAEIGFRDSKFEPHSMADHLWNLCHLQYLEARALYEETLGLSLTDDQLKKLPLFCSEFRVRQSRQLIEGQNRLSLLRNLDSELFHLRRESVSKILTWENNFPTCEYGEAKIKYSLQQPPTSPRTGRTMVVTATRMRHTRARQLARQGVPLHMLSHWLGHTSEQTLVAYYNDPAEQARQLDETMAPALAPFAMAFTGTLIDSADQATRANDQTSKLEFARAGLLKTVGHCGKFSFCATTSVPIPCYRCRYFEPLVDAPHQEVLDALEQRQTAEQQAFKIGGLRNILIPIDLSADIRAVKSCIGRCNARNARNARNAASEK